MPWEPLPLAQEQAWGPASLRGWASAWELEPELQAQQESPARRFWRLPERALPQERGMPWKPLPLAQEQAWGPASLRGWASAWELEPELQAQQEKPARPLARRRQRLPADQGRYCQT